MYDAGVSVGSIHRTLCPVAHSLHNLRLICIAPMQMQNQGDQKMVQPNGSGPSKGIENIEAGNLSNENAERRADAGPDQPFTSIQAFDGVGEYHGICTPMHYSQQVLLL